MNTRVAWILLLSYVLLIALGCFGTWLAIDYLGSEGLKSPPVLPGVKEEMEQRRNGDRSEEPSSAFKTYVDDTLLYANIYRDPRLYIVVPCGMSMLIAGVLVLGGICSRKVFATTISLYSSLGLWIFTLLTAILYQSISWNPDDLFFSTFGWVLGIQLGLLVLLAIQVGLAMWELRRQKTGWPNIYLTHIFTVDAVLQVARLTLGVFALICLSDSGIMYGLRGAAYDYWYSPRVRYPEYYVFPCVAATCYGLIVSFEGTFSLFFGQVHNKLMACTALISAICYAGISVVTSPVFVKAVLGQYWLNINVMIFTAVSSIVNFILAIACMVFPSGVRTPPKFIKMIADVLLSLNVSSREGIIELFNGETLLASSAAVSNAATMLMSKCHLPVRLNWTSLVVSFTAVILIATGMDGPYGQRWGAILMLCGDVAVIFRTLPEVACETYHKRHATSCVIKSVMCLVEDLLLFIGAIGIFCDPWNTEQVVASVINFIYALFHVFFLCVGHKLLHKRSQANAGVAETSEDTKILTDPEDAQVLTDDGQGTVPESFA